MATQPTARSRCATANMPAAVVCVGRIAVAVAERIGRRVQIDVKFSLSTRVLRGA